jgi:hypothetical protein
MVLILLGGLLLRWFEIEVRKKIEKPRKNNEKNRTKKNRLNRLKILKKIFGSVSKT